MRVVAALGGNALLRRGELPDAELQRRHVAEAARSLAELAHDHELIVTHGNGPQVGLLALQSAAYSEVAPYPFDVLGAESEGMVGYLLEQALRNELPERQVAALLTQVLVDADDPAFEAPSKPIGPVYDEPTARRLGAERSWTVQRDGDGWRRGGVARASVDHRDRDDQNAGRPGRDRDLRGRRRHTRRQERRRPPARRGGRHRQGPVGGALPWSYGRTRSCCSPTSTASSSTTGHRWPAAARATPASLAALNLPAGSMGPKAEAARRL